MTVTFVTQNNRNIFHYFWKLVIKCSRTRQSLRRYVKWFIACSRSWWLSEFLDLWPQKSNFYPYVMWHCSLYGSTKSSSATLLTEPGGIYSLTYLENVHKLMFLGSWNHCRKMAFCGYFKVYYWYVHICVYRYLALNVNI